MDTFMYKACMKTNGNILKCGWLVDGVRIEDDNDNDGTETRTNTHTEKQKENVCIRPSNSNPTRYEMR